MEAFQTAVALPRSIKLLGGAIPRPVPFSEPDTAVL
jgi:hypothetical protein